MDNYSVRRFVLIFHKPIMNTLTKTYSPKTLVMKNLAFQPILVLSFILLNVMAAFGQFHVNVTVNSGSATTTCTDPFGAPDPVWGININGEGWETYPGNVFCPVPLPNLQYQDTFQCIADIPPVIQVCLRAFENDPFILDPCTPVLTCQVESCFNLPIPLFGSTNHTLELADTLASDGEANITISVDGFPGGLFDEICDAFDLGIMYQDDQYGDADSSLFNNYCATGINEPSQSIMERSGVLSKVYGLNSPQATTQALSSECWPTVIHPILEILSIYKWVCLLRMMAPVLAILL